MTTTRARLAWALLAAGGLLGAVVVVQQAHLLTAVGYLLVGCAGVSMSCLGAAAARGIRRKIWLTVAVGQVANLVGDAVWLLHERAGAAGSAQLSLSDALYLSRYPMLTLGVVWLVRTRRCGRDVAAFLDAAIIGTGFAVVGMEFVVEPAASAGSSLLAQVVAGAYPVADILVLSVVIGLFTSGAATCLSFWSLVLGLAVMLAADIEFALAQVGGATSPAWVYGGWMASYLLVGFAALHPSVNQLSEPAPTRPEQITFVRLSFLGGALALAPLTEALRDTTGRSGLSPIVVVGGGIGIALVLTRMWQLLKALQRQSAQLEALARHDGLTGVANRRTWDHELARACASATEKGSPLTVAIMDIDHFKVFNDTYGHVVGDLVLKDTAAAWSRVLGSQCFLARFGGEEFTVLLRDTPAEVARPVLERLRVAVTHGQTCSIGYATWDGVEPPDVLVSRADEALYDAKRGGRNRVALNVGPMPAGLQPEAS